MDDVNLRDHQKGSSSLVAECLEKALCLPEDMQELRSFKKCEVFLSLKRDLAKVRYHPPYLVNLNHTCMNTNWYQSCSLSKLPSWPRNGWTTCWTKPGKLTTFEKARAKVDKKLKETLA